MPPFALRKAAFWVVIYALLKGEMSSVRPETCLSANRSVGADPCVCPYFKFATKHMSLTPLTPLTPLPNENK